MTAFIVALFIGIIVGPIVALIVIASRKSKAFFKGLDELTRGIGLQKSGDTPFRATGRVDGFPTTYEEAHLRTQRGRGMVSCVRIRVTTQNTSLPNSAMIEKGWDAIEASRPTAMRVIPTGRPEIDGRYDVYLEDDQSLGFWTSSSSSPRMAALLRDEGPGRIHEISLYQGQLTLLAGFSMKVEAQRKLFDAALELARQVEG